MKNSGFAIASMVLGIVGLVFKLMVIFDLIAVPCALVGLVLGLSAKKAITNSGGELKGTGMATAGIVLTIITLALWVLALAACSSFASLLK